MLIDGSTDHWHVINSPLLIHDLLITLPISTYLSIYLHVVPSEHDVVDMLQILTELTMPSDVYEEYSRANNINIVMDDPNRRQGDRFSEERSIPKTTIVVIEGMM